MEEKEYKKEDDMMGIDRILSSHSFGPMTSEVFVLDVCPMKNHLPHKH